MSVGPDDKKMVAQTIQELTNRTPTELWQSLATFAAEQSAAAVVPVPREPDAPIPPSIPTSTQSFDPQPFTLGAPAASNYYPPNQGGTPSTNYGAWDVLWRSDSGTFQIGVFPGKLILPDGTFQTVTGFLATDLSSGWHNASTGDGAYLKLTISSGVVSAAGLVFGSSGTDKYTYTSDGASSPTYSQDTAQVIVGFVNDDTIPPTSPPIANTKLTFRVLNSFGDATGTDGQQSIPLLVVA